MANETAEHILSKIEEIFLLGRISNRERQKLITDTPDIAQNIRANDTVEIIKNDDASLIISSSNYRRYYAADGSAAEEFIKG